VLGEEVVRDTKCDPRLVNELMQIAQQNGKNYDIVKGKTVCADDFYEGQGRLDGYFCDYDQEKKLAFLRRCREQGVVNFEMESLCFAGMLSHAKIKCILKILL
jgi:uridine phosphorylase